MATFSKDCLRRKSLLITGSLGAIGRVAVSRLLDHSASVAVNDILPESDARTIINEARWPAHRAIYVMADVTKPDGAEEAVARTLRAFGRIDVALCHVGIACSCPILDYSEEQWVES